MNSRGALANESSLRPAVSADGAHVAFESSASNLAVKDTNHEIDIFVHAVLR